MNKMNFKTFLSLESCVNPKFCRSFYTIIGISLVVFYFVAPKSASNYLRKLVKNKNKRNLPKTEECPINGEMYTTAESSVWNTRRPIAAMIENHVDARPESGLSRADVVYEAVAEGGITRFLSIFIAELLLKTF
jgi:hypothetical protein